MASEYLKEKELLKEMGVTGPFPSHSAIGMPEPVAHPRNCSNECPYGHDRTFCFPCMAKIMAERRAKKNEVKED